VSLEEGLSFDGVEDCAVGLCVSGWVILRGWGVRIAVGMWGVVSRQGVGEGGAVCPAMCRVGAIARPGTISSCRDYSHLDHVNNQPTPSHLLTPNPAAIRGFDIIFWPVNL
jgi:hypothetical protein